MPLIASIEIAGPFNILTQTAKVKAQGRKPPFTGEPITPKAVQASSSGEEAAVTNLIDGSRLRDLDGDYLNEHSSNPAAMWRSAKSDTTGWLEFDLGEPRTLSTLCVWNYNDTWHLNRGVQKMDVSIWTPQEGWRKVDANRLLQQAEGGDDYDEPTVVNLETTMAQKVRLDNLAGFGGADCIGLSKVQFFGPRGAQAAVFSPQDDGKVASLSDVVLTWIPGEGAVAHNVYFGTDSRDLRLLGKSTGVEARLSRLANQSTYYWRIDEAQADGSVVTGRTWSFTTCGVIAWWKLDESEGRHVSDASPWGHTGACLGEPTWRPTDGRIGGALEFDGEDDCVQIADEVPFRAVDEITVAAWIKVRSFDRTWQTVVAKGEASWRLARDRDNETLQWCAGSPQENRVVRGKVNVNDGKWHHLVGVSDGDTVSLYVDGVVDQTLSSSGRMRVDDVPVCIGLLGEPGLRGRYWNGWIDEVCIFSYALNAEEVKALYSGKEPTSLGLRPGTPMPTLLGQR